MKWATVTKLAPSEPRERRIGNKKAPLESQWDSEGKLFILL